MNNKRCMVRCLLGLFWLSSLSGECTVPISGDRVWNLAAAALGTMNTINSEVEVIAGTVAADFAGVFTVAQQIELQLAASELLARQADSVVDQLTLLFPETFSMLSVVESKTEQLIGQLDGLSVDMSGVFTALSALQTNMHSQLEQLIMDLEQIEQTVVVLTESEVDRAFTIASQLNVLQTDVDLLNSALDALNIVIELNGVDSYVDILTSLVDHLNTDVDMLHVTIEQGFVGTFSALDAQRATALTIESLVDVIGIDASADFNGVFTALQELEQTVVTMNSLVDAIPLATTLEVINTVASNIDIAASKITVIESEVIELSSLADHTASVLESTDRFISSTLSSNIDNAISLLEVMASETVTISSKISELNIDIESNTSNLELIDTELIGIASSVAAIDATTSTLLIIDSEVDLLITQAIAIESIIDQIDITLLNSSIDSLGIVSQADALLSQIGIIEQTTRTISSELDLLITHLDITDSILDITAALASSNLEELFTIESRIDALPLPTSVISSIDSKMIIIEDLAFTAESKLDSMISLIDLLNGDAQALIGDFQQTWTILDAIDRALSIDESLLEEISLDASGVFTVIESILLIEETVDSKLDSTATLIDILISQQNAIAVEFTGVFTALKTILIEASSIASQADIIESKVDIIDTYYGIPIYASSLPLTITKPERYFLAENIKYGGSTNAITVNTNNVCIDLDDRVLTYTGASSIVGIQINSSNVQINNGSILGFIVQWNVASSTNNVIIRNVNSSGNAVFNATRNSFVNNCVFIYGVSDSFGLYGNTNAKITNCFFLEGQTALETRGVGANNLYVADCSMMNSERGIGCNGAVVNLIAQRLQMSNNSPTGIDLSSVTLIDFVCTDCLIQGAAIAGIRSVPSATSTRHVYLNNTISNCGTYGMSLATINCYVGFNTFIQNAANVNEPFGGTGPNTYLGNFAFNSTAVGNPNNTNYTFSSSTNIAGKYVTVSEHGSFSDYPTKWHNINMLP